MPEFSTFPPKIDEEDWNALLDHGLEKPASYIIRNNNGTIQAINGSTGKIDYSGTNAATVIQSAINALTGGGLIAFSKGLFLINTSISGADNITFWGQGAATEIRANATIGSVFNITSCRYNKFFNLFINGYGLATRCIDGARTPSAVPVHLIQNCKIWGATESNVDFTGCEDSTMIDVWIDGRRDVSEPPTLYTNYGIQIGRAGDGYATGGHIKLIDVKLGFHKKCDIWTKNVAKVEIIESLLSSKGSYSTVFEANLIIEGGSGTPTIWPKVGISHSWFENDNAKPNILIKNVQGSQLDLASVYLATGESPNIYSALSKALQGLTIMGGHFERPYGVDGYHIVCPCDSLFAYNPEFYGGYASTENKISLTNVDRYWITNINSSFEKTNLTRGT